MDKEEKATDREAGYALTESLVQISETLWEQKNTALIPDLETTSGLLKQSGTDEDTLKRFQRSLDALKATKNAQLIPQNVRENPFVSAFLGFFTIVPLSLLFTWVLLLRLKPLWLLKIYNGSQTIRKAEPPSLIKEGLSYLFLIRFFAYHPRVLDAWVAINLGKICERFNQIQQVKNNSSHISMPPFVPENDEKFKEVFTPKLVRLLITGGRGVGKTNLACWLVTQVMKKPFILDHPIIPIWIDEIPVGEANDKKNWLKLKTQAIIQEVYEIPDISLDLSNALLRERRILVVIDPIPKNNREDFKKLLQPENLEGINCLIVASRYGQILKFIRQGQEILIDHLAGQKLDQFVKEYIEKFIPEEGVYEVCHQQLCYNSFTPSGWHNFYKNGMKIGAATALIELATSLKKGSITAGLIEKIFRLSPPELSESNNLSALTSREIIAEYVKNYLDGKYADEFNIKPSEAIWNKQEFEDLRELLLRIGKRYFDEEKRGLNKRLVELYADLLVAEDRKDSEEIEQDLLRLIARSSRKIHHGKEMGKVPEPVKPHTTFTVKPRQIEILQEMLRLCCD